MRNVTTALWLLVPIGLIGWHFGPGQTFVAQDDSRVHLVAAQNAVAIQNWPKAVEQYEMAITQWPDEGLDRIALEMNHANALVMSGQIVKGQEQLEDILVDMEESQSDSEDHRRVIRHARSELAQASYYAAWLMRLEGATEGEWLPEVERSRQLYRLLAENEAESQSNDLTFHKNLESAIRLGQMDLSVLKGKLLPKNCPNPSCCKGLSQRKRKQCQGRCNKPGGKKPGKKKKPKTKDARKQILKGAGVNRRTSGGS